MYWPPLASFLCQHYSTSSIFCQIASARPLHWASRNPIPSPPDLSLGFSSSTAHPPTAPRVFARPHSHPGHPAPPTSPHCYPPPTRISRQSPTWVILDLIVLRKPQGGSSPELGQNLAAKRNAHFAHVTSSLPPSKHPAGSWPARVVLVSQRRALYRCTATIVDRSVRYMLESAGARTRVSYISLLLAPSRISGFLALTA